MIVISSQSVLCIRRMIDLGSEEQRRILQTTHINNALCKSAWHQKIGAQGNVPESEFPSFQMMLERVVCVESFRRSPYLGSYHIGLVGVTIADLVSAS